MIDHLRHLTMGYSRSTQPVICVLNALAKYLFSELLRGNH